MKQPYSTVVKFLVIIGFFIFNSNVGYSQVIAACSTPTYTVDLSSNPEATFTTAVKLNRDVPSCCSSPNELVDCRVFYLIRHPNSAGVEVQLSSPNPGGNGNMLLNGKPCPTPYPGGGAQCIPTRPGLYTDTLTFCKTGSGATNYYTFISKASPTFPPDQDFRIGCTLLLKSYGVLDNSTSVTWTGIPQPGYTAADLENYLSFTSPGTYASPVYDPSGYTPPAVVQYEVTGSPSFTLCTTLAVTSTVTITNYPELTASILPSQPSFCPLSSVTLTVTPEDGLAPYSYIWKSSSSTNLGTSSTYSASVSTTYSVVVTDEINTNEFATCPTLSPSVFVDEGVPAIINAGEDDTLCATDPIINLSGSITQGATGGTWTGGTTAGFNPSRNVLNAIYTPTSAEILAGTITFTLTSTGAGGGCENSSDIVEYTFSDTVEVSISSATLSCYSSTVSITASYTGGISPLTYHWNTGASTASISVGQGNFTALVTDEVGCTGTASTSLTAPTALSLTFTTSDVTTNGGSDGQASANVSGGTSPYTYSWSPGNETTSLITGLSYGVYTATVTDANGCTISGSVVINEPRCAGFEVTATSTNVTCYGSATGTGTAVVSGGTPQSYSWSNTSQTTANVSDLPAGVYTVTVVSTDGCIQTANITVTEPTIITNTFNQTNPTVAGASTGSATSNPFGGVSPYTYLWSPGGATTATINNIPEGVYTVYITDANGCIKVDSVKLNDPECNQIVLNVVSTNVACYGASSGSATADVVGATAPYSYLWYPGNQTTASISNLPVGYYSVTLTDGAGCVLFNNFTITQPSNLSASVSTTSISCYNLNDGTADLSVSGGLYPYTFSWSNGATTEDIINTTPTSYTVTVTDANSCTETATASYTNPDTLIASHISVDPTCIYGSDGSIDYSVVGGVTPYSYLWLPGNETTQDISGLDADEYTILLDDANGCSPPSNLKITISNPDSVYVVSHTVACADTTIGESLVTIVPGGGNGGRYYVSFDDGANYQVVGDYNKFVVGDSTYNVWVQDSTSCVSLNPYPVVVDPKVEILNVAFSNCFSSGATTTTFTVTTTGGDGGPLSISYDGGSNYQTAGVSTFTVSVGASYSIIAKDGSGCTSTVYNILIPDVLEASITSSTNILCKNGSNGAATVTATGGDGDYTYLWNDGAGQVTATATGLTAGTYSVTVTDGNGCTRITGVTLSEPTLLTSSASVTSNYNGEDISCNGASDGEATVTPSGGTGIPTYLWNDGSAQTTATATGLDATSYTVTVTDGNGCVSTSTVTLTEPTVLTTTMSITSNYNGEDISCNGASDGEATVTPSGGTGAYTYLWNDGAAQTTATATGLDATSYTVTVTDVNGCMSTSTVTLTEPPVLTTTMSITSNYNGEDISCNGASDGEATVSPSGGTGAYTYLWNDGAAQTTAIATGLDATSYTVTVTDVNGCVSTSTVTLTEPPVLATTMSITSNYNGEDISCNGASDGEATVTPSGGTGAYTYLWNDVAAQTTAIATGLDATSYTVTVTDVNGCISVSTVTLTEPTLLTSSAAVTSNYNGEDISCNGASDGQATVTPLGGTGAYTYLWNDGAAQTTAIATGLDATSYTVTVTDVNGCISTSTVTLTEPPVLTTSMSITSNYNGEDISCNGASDGEATVTPSGGTGAYTYLWNDGGAQTTAIATGLDATSYTVTVTDVNGCISTSTVTLTEPPVLTTTMSITSNYNGEDISCNGASDGKAKVTAVGGTGARTYLWNDGGSQTTSQAVGLDATSYTVTVTDANGCISTSTVTLTEPPALTTTMSITSNYNGEDISCNGASDGEATITPSGGTGTPTYLWNDGSAQVTAVATGLDATSYTVTVTDVNGCVSTSTVTLTEPILLTSSAAVTSNYNGEDISCNNASDGEATVTPAGGTGAVTYLWNDGGAQTTAIATGLDATIYSVTVTDVNGCVSTSTVTLTEPTLLTSSAAITSNYNGEDISCNNASDGEATVTPSGGTGSYTYLWNDGGAQTTAIATGLDATSYTVTVTDVNGCISTSTVTLTEPPVLTSTTSITSNYNGEDISCNGASDGSAKVTAVGGTGARTYLWNDGGAQTTAIATGLDATSYTVTVTDVNGCISTSAVTLTEPPVLTTTMSITSNYNGEDISCNGASDGEATVTPAGGTGAVTYLWNDGGAQTTAIATGLDATSYTVTVTDVNGCISTSTVTLTEPTVLTSSAAVTSNYNGEDISCNGASDGEATVTPAGGTGAVTYLWNDGGAQTTAVATGLDATSYTVTVTDVNGCVNTSTVTLTQPDELSISSTVTNETCDYSDDGSITTSVSGGTGPFTYLWTNTSETTSSISGLVADTYTVTTTDVNGCTAIDISLLTQPAPLVISYSDQANVKCNGGDDGAVTAGVTGGTANYSFSWMPGSATTSSIRDLTADTYTTTITDAQGCVEINTVTISEPLVLTVAVSADSALCYGTSTGTVTATPSGGTGPFTYQWSIEGGSTQSVANVSAGNKTVEVTDINQCVATNTVTVGEPDQIVPTVVVTDATCTTANGIADITGVAGGTGPYTYEWSNGATTNDITNVFSGQYTFTVTDSHACTNTAATGFANVNDAGVPIGTLVSKSDVSCFAGTDGEIIFTISGGTPPYTVEWLDLEVIDPFPAGDLYHPTLNPTGARRDSVISKIPEGTYTARITDSNGCQSFFTESIGQPEKLTAFVNSTDLTCYLANDGEASVEAFGGVGGYTYAWTGGPSTTSSITGLSAASHTVTITDANNCKLNKQFDIEQPDLLEVTSISSTPVLCFGETNGTATVDVVAGGTEPYGYSWMPGSIQGVSISNLPPTTYTVTVTDINSCVATATVTVTEPDEVVLVMDSINSNCSLANGQASVVVTGGTGPATYTYSWSPTGGTDDIATGLFAQQYTVTVSDGNGCTKQSGVTVNDNPSPVATITSHTNVYCKGGSTGDATVSVVVGGSASLTYLWSPSGGTTTTAVNLVADTYTVTVTDGNGCTSSDTEIITEPAAVLSASVTAQTNVYCKGGSTGSATVTASGGSGSYSYLWNDPLSQTTATANGLTATSYTVTVFDNNGCLVPVIASVTITEPAAVLSASITAQTNVYCKGGSTGTATVTASGGSGSYSYQWNNPFEQISATATGLSATNYTVTVTDNNGCLVPVQAVATITEPAAVLSASVTAQTNVYCRNGSTGSATVTASGGSGSYSYFWNDALSQTTVTATGLSATVYSVVVFDSNGCLDPVEASVTITEPVAVLSASISGKTNVYCRGGSTGSATVTASGGSGSYSYLWNDGSAQTTATATGLSAASYTVTIFDNNGCLVPVKGFVTITEPAAVLSASVTTQTNVYCKGGSTGSATVTGSGGSGFYSYLWNDALSQTTATATGLSATTYTVTVFDKNGCLVPVTTSVTLTEPAAVLSASITAQTNVYCKGDNTGTATVTASGGSGSYSYQWNNPFEQITATATDLSVGSYTVTVFDNNGCLVPVEAIATITEPAAVLSASVTAQTNVFCKGGSTGTATVTAAGGSGSYSYLWNDGLAQTTATATGLSATAYTVTVFDNNGCTTPVTASVTLTEPAAVLSAAITGQTNVSCTGGNTGTATVAASGGSGSYSYLWNNALSQTTTTATGLFATTYTVTVTDNNGCLLPVLKTVTIIEPLSPLTATITAQTNVYCKGGNTGTATVTASGGSGLYAYLWNDGSTQTTATATGLSATSYTVSISDKNGCASPVAISATITEPTAVLSATITAQTNVFCKGGNNGVATVTASGGSGSYSYVWNDPLSQTTATATGLSADVYTVLVFDNNGCLLPAEVLATVTEPSTALSATITAQTNVYCKSGTTGSATVTASGGSGSYSYLWSDALSQTTATAIGLSAATYTVAVFDSNGCITPVEKLVTITEPSAALSATITAQTNVFCKAGITGSATVTASGGSGSYSYLWNDALSQTTKKAIGLSAATYTVTVSDNNGCIVPVLSSVTITEPGGALTATITAQTNVICKGGVSGTATVTASGGSGSYSYLWSNISAQTTATATGLTAKTYTVTVSDNNGCSIPVKVSTTIIEPAAVLTATITAQTNVLCKGGATGAATVSASGGSGSYLYTWNDALTQSTATASGLIANSYTVTVMDANGCAASLKKIATITEPTAVLSASITAQTNVFCKGDDTGIATVTARGGSGSYSYLWDDASAQTTATAIGLFAGANTVTVSDNNGCTIPVVKIATIAEPALILTTTLTAQTNVYCKGDNSGSATVTGVGGSGNYNYSWNDNTNQNTATATGLVAGSYTVTVSDQNGCVTVTTRTVTITEPSSALDATTSKTDIACKGGTDGTATATGTGGSGTYSYLWSTGQTGQTITGLIGGVYTVKVTDNNGCSEPVYKTATISEPAALLDAVATSQTNVSCFGLTDAAVTVTASGGSGSYSYSWSTAPVQTTATITGLAQGTYTVTVNDNNGCTVPAIEVVTITEPTALSANITSHTDIYCHIDSSGTATVTATGGTLPYSYLWSSSQTAPTSTYLDAGSYTVVVTDYNGCVFPVTDPVVISDSSVAVTLSSPIYHSIYNISTFQGTDGAIDLNVIGGVSPFVYDWSNGSTTQDISGLTAGTYSVTVTDFAGCLDTAIIVLTEPNELWMPTGITPNGDGFNDALFVTGLNAYPTNHLIVFNRWGNIVFEVENYNSDWYGTNKQGEPLAEGTYFVILEINNKEKVLAQYLDIRR